MRARSMSDPVHHELRHNYAIYNTTMAHLENLPVDSRVRIVAPPDVKRMASRTTRNAELILATVQHARQDLERSLDNWYWL